jgi:hypothetical protein
MMNQSNMCRKTVFSCFMRIGSYVSQIALGRFARKTSERAAFMVLISALVLRFVGGLQCLTLVVRGACGEIWDCINFVQEWKES